MTIPANPQSLVEIIENKIIPDETMTSLCAVSKLCLSQWKMILAELIATMLLIVFGCMACIPITGYPLQPPLYAPIGFGFVVSFNVQIFGHISGAHMNPAVTLASLIWGSTSFVLSINYIIAQCIGAIIGYGILLAVSPVDLIANGICMTLPNPGHTSIQALVIEIVLTATLSLICCSCWDPVNEHKQESVPLKFGLAIAGLSIAGGPMTGASMNPARTLAPSVWTGIWSAHWIYWTGPFIGSAIATIFYKYIWLKKIHSN